MDGLGDIFLNEKVAIASYRHAVSTVIPEMTLARDGFAAVSPALRANLLAFYRDRDGPNATKDCTRMWRRTIENVNRLKGLRRARDGITRIN
jgi:hypothetical protein